jgi:protein-S-isoprenylcysteine O-methyltransferase Ste14
MNRILPFLFGLAAYIVFLGTFLYAIGFVAGVVVPKSIDTGPVTPVVQSVVINVLLLALFAVQHSVMARKTFKHWWTQFIPKAIERSMYVLLASLALILLFWLWQPIHPVVWRVTDPATEAVLFGLSLFGWVIVLFSTFLINHFELFGLRQVMNESAARSVPAPTFRTPLLYNLVRHPIYVGFIIAFWATPVMTCGHLLFATVTTAYILIGIALEERDLIEAFGDEYRRYRRRVGMLLPIRPRS